MGGRVWTPAEDQQLRAAKGRYGQLAAVGRQIGRSPGAVRVRLHALRSQDPGIEHAAADVEHARAPAYPVRTEAPPAPPGPGPGEPGRAAPSSSRRHHEEIERRINERVRSLLAAKQEETS